MNGATISALGTALPEAEVTNRDLAGRLGVSESWIRGACGIESRRVASPSDTTASLGTRAAARALESVGLAAEEIDLIICATITADRRFPAVGCLIGGALGVRAPAFDLNAGCAGFLFALAQAEAVVHSGRARRVLVIGSDVLTRLTDQDDSQTAILFGDGAGAAVVEWQEEGSLGPFFLHSDGTRPDLLTVDEHDLIRMKGREVYRSAVEGMSSAISEALESAGASSEDVDLVIAHQANQRILDAVAARLGVPEGVVYSNIATLGNTSAASIPLALDQASAEGRLCYGHLVMLTAFGAGFCWGAGLTTWRAGVEGIDGHHSRSVSYA